jgi:hypothetical protein
MTERFNGTLLDMLSMYVSKHQKNWSSALPYVLFAYRSSVHESTGKSPFELLYGRQPRLPIDEALNTPVNLHREDPEFYHTMAEQMTQAWSIAQERIGKAQDKQKASFDRRTFTPKVSEGDQVMVYVPGVGKGKSPKLAHLYKGPFEVKEVKFPLLKVVMQGLWDKKDSPSPTWVNIDRVKVFKGTSASPDPPTAAATRYNLRSRKDKN